MATDRRVPRTPPQVGKTDSRILYGFVADDNALKRTDPVIDRLAAEPATASTCDDAGRIRRDTHSGGSRYVQHRRAGTRIELRVYRLPVDLDRQDDLRSDVIDRLDIDFACALGCPVSQRLAAAILRLVQLDRVVGQIELDVCLVEKILAEDEGDFATEISFPCDYHPPILARDLADLDLIYIDGLDLGFAADTEHPITPDLLSG